MANDNLHCKVCFEDYNDSARKPKILTKCGHTFCLECVLGFYRAALHPECPLCREFVGLPISELKDNYELMELLGTNITDKAPKFYCENCSAVASKHCTDHHSIRSLASVVADKISKSRQDLENKIGLERGLLENIREKLKSTLQAIENKIVARLEYELDVCQRRKEYLDHLSQDFDIAQKTITMNGDFSLLTVFDLIDNKGECDFLQHRIDAQKKAFQSQLTTSVGDEGRSFTLGQSDEDRVLAYLISILSLQPQSKDISNSGSVTQPTHWMPSPWLTVWGRHKEQDICADDVDNDVHSDNESVASEFRKAEASNKIYVSNIQDQFASSKALKDIFSQYGKVSKVTVINARRNGKNPFFAFIEFDYEDTASNVLHLKEEIYHDFGLRVQPPKRRCKKEERPELVKDSTTQLKGEWNQKNQLFVDSAGHQLTNDQAQHTLFIQNIPVDTPEHRISELFSKYGPVKDVRKLKKTLPGKNPRAFGFVTYINKCSVQCALKDKFKVCWSPGVVVEFREYHHRTGSNTESRKVDSIPAASTNSPSLSASNTAISFASTPTQPTVSLSQASTVQQQVTSSAAKNPMSPAPAAPRPLMSSSFSSYAARTTAPSIHTSTVTRSTTSSTPSSISTRPSVYPNSAITRPFNFSSIATTRPSAPPCPSVTRSITSSNSSSISTRPSVYPNSAVTRPTTSSNSLSTATRPSVCPISTSAVTRPTSFNSSYTTTRSQMSSNSASNISSGVPLSGPGQASSSSWRSRTPTPTSNWRLTNAHPLSSSSEARPMIQARQSTGNHSTATGNHSTERRMDTPDSPAASSMGVLPNQALHAPPPLPAYGKKDKDCSIQ